MKPILAHGIKKDSLAPWGFSPEKCSPSILERERLLPFPSLLSSSIQTASSVHSVTPSELPINRHCKKNEVFLLCMHSQICVTAGWICVPAVLKKYSLGCGWMLHSQITQHTEPIHSLPLPQVCEGLSPPRKQLCCLNLDDSFLFLVSLVGWFCFFRCC